MRDAEFWRRDSAEALSRTFIDLVLFDRLRVHQEEVAAKHLYLRGKYQLHARTLAKQQVSGSADYVLGYDPLDPTEPKSFESFSIVVEAKKGSIYQGLGQAVAYMVAAQQHRLSLKPQRIVNTIYGIVSDGIRWQFLQLEGKKLLISDEFRTIKSSGRTRVYLFVDRIIRASIASSPHTIPRHRFPATQDRWREGIESEIFEDPPSPSKKALMAPIEFSGAGAGGEIDPNDVEEYEILRSGGSAEVGGKSASIAYSYN